MALGRGAAWLTWPFFQPEKNNEQNDVNDAVQRQEESVNQLESDLQNRQNNQESEAAKAKTRDEAKQRQKVKAQGAIGRRDTILTGPLGLTSEAPTTAKTLLGA